MLEILKAGGWAMAPILLCSAIMVAIVLERFWTLRRKSVMPLDLGEQVSAWARSQKLDPQHIDALRGNSPLGELLASVVVARHRGREAMKEHVEDTGRHIIHQLERFLNTLGTIALVSPLLGLLGTVFGLIRMFLVVAAGNMGDPSKMAGGIGEALICTAAGLCVAIPSYFFHRYFRGKIAGYVVEMEKHAIALMDELETQNEVRLSIPPRAVPRTHVSA